MNSPHDSVDSVDLVGLHTAALAVNVPATWLKREALAGRIPHLRAGRRLLFALAAVRAVLVERASTGVMAHA